MDDSHMLILDSKNFSILSVESTIVLLSLLLGWAFLPSKVLRRNRAGQFAIVAAPFIAFLGILASSLLQTHVLAILLINVFLFLIGELTIFEGVKAKKPFMMVTGTLVLAVVITARFFDSDFSLLARGFTFIVLGLCIFTANYSYIRYIASKDKPSHSTENSHSADGADKENLL